MAGMTLTPQSQTANGKTFKVAERQGSQQCAPSAETPVNFDLTADEAWEIS
jgi:hypothetical protein